MRRHFLAAMSAAAVLLAHFLSPASGATTAGPGRPARVSEILAWTNEIYTRVAIYTGEEVEWKADTAAADPKRGLPPRIFVDLSGAGIHEEILRRPVEVRNGLLRQVRAGRHSRDVVRVVIDLERESPYRVFALENPFRIVVDVDGEGEIPAPRAEARPAPPPDTEVPAGSGPPATEKEGAPAVEARGDRAAAETAESAPPRRHRVRVMIDPGHGGKDSGAIGPTGLKEKDVVLAVGRMVRERLARAGEYDVRMTRDADVFIPLEERTAMANKARAELFVSLHINASPNRRAEGISTYVLSRGAANREDLELAARENGVPVARLSAVKYIIDDMFTGARKNESLRLAKTVNDSIVRNVSARFSGVQNLGLKQAPFYVLVGARMTAVLVESSFISNGREEARLRDPAYLERIADGVAEAVRYYGQNGILARTGD